MCKVYEAHYECSHTRTIELAPCAASQGHMLGPVPPPPVKSTSSHKRNPSVHEINLQLLKLSLSQKKFEQELGSSSSKSTSTATRQPIEELPDFKFPATKLTRTSSNPETNIPRNSPNKFKIPSISKIAAPVARPLPPLPVAADNSFFLNSFTGLKPHVGFKVEELIEGATFIPKFGLMCRNGICVRKQEPQGLACENCRLLWMENAKKCGVLKGGCVLKKGEEARRLMDTLYESENESDSGWGVLLEADSEGEWEVDDGGVTGLGLSLDDALEADRNRGFDFGFPPNGARAGESSSYHADRFDFKSDDISTPNRGRESGNGSTIHKGLGLFTSEDSMSKDASYSGSVHSFGFRLDDDSTDVPTPSPSPSPKEKIKQPGSKAWWFMGPC